ncbi:uncharacterized protein LOC125807119 [Solanum verrucosum]|uniref:uncharacterized protein LOC125807119 n=1 Tax=Solanum verrucosum TaxID=315347 RepID=UPI0020D1B0FC|nr:uncharacterized protein LOC125807119 [Solanum verrucosum]
MAFFNKIIIVFTISLFLTTIPSKAYNIQPKTHAPSHAPIKPSSSSSSSSYVAPKATIEIPKNIPTVPNTRDVSVFINSMMEATMTKTEEFIANVIEQRLEEPDTDIYATNCLETCKSVYQDAVDAMKKAEEDVKAKDYYKANLDISAMTTDIDTCNECAISIYGEDTEFRQFDNWIQGVASECLEKISALTK